MAQASNMYCSNFSTCVCPVSIIGPYNRVPDFFLACYALVTDVKTVRSRFLDIRNW